MKTSAILLLFLAALCPAVHAQEKPSDDGAYAKARAVVRDLERIVAPSGIQETWKARIGGMVDSPTPTVPISSDSTSTRSSSPWNCCDSAAAAIQPAVPPPAITTRRI